MPLNRCLTVAHFKRESDRTLLEQRIRSLVALYEHVGPVHIRTKFLDHLRLLVAVVSVGTDAESPLESTWGNHLPRGFDVVHARDADLRDLPTPLAAFGERDGTATIVTAPGGATSLYSAGSQAITAWSSHAVAASWLATGAAAVDEESIAELVAWEFVGGSRTLLAGVRAVPQATRIAITPGGSTERCYWAPADRWGPIDPEDARREAPAAFLAGLDAQLSGARRPVLGLTGGVDSRTVAVALRDLEIPFTAFTFVADLGSMQDAAASAAVTEPLSLAHDLREIALWDEGIALRAAEAGALWSDGCAPIGLGSIPWPQDLSHWVVGVGAEVGRAFYYRWSSPRPGVPSRRLLERILASDMELDLGGARLDVRTRLRSRAREWVDAAYGRGIRAGASSTSSTANSACVVGRGPSLRACRQPT